MLSSLLTGAASGEFVSSAFLLGEYPCGTLPRIISFSYLDQGSYLRFVPLELNGEDIILHGKVP